MQTQQGRQKIILETIDAHEKNLIRYAMSLLGDLERARDIVQETFLRLIRLSNRHPIPDHPWLYTVCRNLVIDFQRKESRMESYANQAELPFCSPKDSNPQLVTESKDLMQKVMARLAHLPDRQKEILRLKFQCGLSYREISEITSVSTSNVGYLIHTAIRTIREEFSQELQQNMQQGGAQ